MNDNLLESLTTQATSFYGPMGKINALMVSNIEKVAEFQLGAVKSYAELAMKQWKQVAGIRDIETFKDFGLSQSESASEMSQKIIADMMALGEMGMEFKTQVEEIIAEANNPTEEVKEAPKAKVKPSASAKAETKA